MTSYTGGSYVQFEQDWPAIVLDVKDIPEHMVNDSAIGTIPVLLMSKHQLHWASADQLSEFTPLVADELEELSEDIQVAYDEVYSSLGNDWDAHHWAEVYLAGHLPGPSSRRSPPASSGPLPKTGFTFTEWDCSSEEDSVASWDDGKTFMSPVQPKTPKKEPTQPVQSLKRSSPRGSSPTEAKFPKSSFGSVKKASSKDGDNKYNPINIDSEDESDSASESPNTSLSSSRTLSADEQKTAERIPQKNEVKTKTSTPSPKIKVEEQTPSSRVKLEPKTPSPKVLKSTKEVKAIKQEGLSPKAPEPAVHADEEAVHPESEYESDFESSTSSTGAVYDEDLRANDQLVTFFIGPHDEEFIVPRASIQERGYFREILALEGNNWVMRRAAYKHIDPTKFTLVAQFLATGGYGHKYSAQVDDPAFADELLAESIDTFEVARELAMDDLLDCIVSKIMGLTAYITPLAGLSYAAKVFENPTEEACMGYAEKWMLDTGVEYVCEKFWTFVTDHPTSLKAKLDASPALAERVFAKLAENAKTAKEAADAKEDEEDVESDASYDHLNDFLP